MIKHGLRRSPQQTGAMARDLQRELIKKARTGVIDTEKGTRALAREVKKVVGGNHGLDYNEDPPSDPARVDKAPSKKPNTGNKSQKQCILKTIRPVQN